MNDPSNITLGALVSTELGEGYVFGRSLITSVPMYDVRLFDGIECSTYVNPQKRPVISKLVMLDRMPVDHPQIPKGMKLYLRGG